MFLDSFGFDSANLETDIWASPSCLALALLWVCLVAVTSYVLTAKTVIDLSKLAQI